VNGSLGKRILRGAVLCWLCYVLPVNLFLAIPLSRKVIAPHPERFTIDWRWAVSIVPCLVHVRGLGLTQHTPKDQWSLTVEEATSLVNLPALAVKTFHTFFVSASGVRFELIEAEKSLEPVRKKGKGFRILLAGMTIDDIRQTSFYGVVLEGAGIEAGGKMDTTARGPFALPGAWLHVTEGRVSHENNTLAENLNLEITVSIDRHVKKERQESGILKFISGRIETTARVGDLRFLDTFLRSVPWIEVRGGRGTLDAGLEFSKGRLDSGSRAVVTTSSFDFSYLDYTVSGKGLVLLEGPDGERDRSRFSFDLDDFSLGFSDSPTPHLKGDNLSLVVTGPVLNMLRSDAAVDVSIMIPKAQIPDFRVYNRYFSTGSSVKFLSGTGELESSLFFSSGLKTGGGKIRVSVEDLVTALALKKIVGDLESNFDIVIENLSEGRFRVDGSEIKLRRTGIEMPEKDPDSARKAPERDWWCTIGIPRGRIRLAKPIEADFEVTLDAKDAGPILGLISKTRKKMEKLDRLLGIDDLKGSARLGLHGKSTEISDLSITGGRAEILGRLCFVNHRTDGILYLRYGILSLGVRIEDGEEKKHLPGPRKWYEKNVGAADGPISAVTVDSDQIGRKGMAPLQAASRHPITLPDTTRVAPGGWGLSSFIFHHSTCGRSHGPGYAFGDDVDRSLRALQRAPDHRDLDRRGRQPQRDRGLRMELRYFADLGLRRRDRRRRDDHGGPRP